MITYEKIIEAQQYLVENWEEDGKRVIEACYHSTPYNNTFETFLEECTCCGGNWGGMILTGIKKVFPEVWEAIPDKMGVFAFGCLCNTLILCGVDTSE